MCFLFFISATSRECTLWRTLCAFKYVRLKARRTALVVVSELAMVLENSCRVGRGKGGETDARSKGQEVGMSRRAVSMLSSRF